MSFNKKQLGKDESKVNKPSKNSTPKTPPPFVPAYKRGGMYGGKKC